jgi:hypothetical protein
MRKILYLVVILSFIAQPVCAEINYVKQKSELMDIPDAERMSRLIWVEVEPTVDKMTLHLPAWTFYYHFKSLNLPKTEIEFTADPTYPKYISVFIVPTADETDNYAVTEVLLDGMHQPPAIEPFEETGQMQIIWFEIAPGDDDLSDNEINVLRHYQPQ